MDTGDSSTFVSVDCVPSELERDIWFVMEVSPIVTPGEAA